MFSRRRFRRLLLGVARASQPSCRRLLRSSDASCRCGSSCSALHHCAPAATTASADFCPAFTGQISRGKTRDLRSIYPSHLRPSVRVNIGLRVSPPPRPPTSASYALRVPRAGALPPSFFPTPPRDDAVALRLGVPVTKAPRGLSPPSHFPLGFRLAVLCAIARASRHARRTEEASRGSAA